MSLTRRQITALATGHQQHRLRTGMPIANRAREAYLAVPHQTWADKQELSYPMLKGGDRYCTALLGLILPVLLVVYGLVVYGCAR